MSLMKLPPESVRLRRMAKAYAAGEMTQAEYRAARREVIDNFPVAPQANDDTQRRWPEEPTLRSGARGDASPGAEQTFMSTSPAMAESSGWAKRWLWLVALALTAAAAVLALPEARAAAGDVPPVRERSADPAASPRVEVREVQVAWAGAASDGMSPELLASLQQHAAQRLAEVRAAGAPGPHGFTPSELNEVARYLNVLGVHEGQGGLDAADARDLSALIRDQKRRRGVSVAQLEEVADAVQARLRERGYFLAAAYLPAQQVEGGVVRIDVLPGRLGDIVVEGGDARPVAGVFAPLLGQPLTLADVSSRLQALNALPGVTAQASFGPGAEVGQSRLRLDLLEQRDWVATASLDNHGDDETGEQRLSVTGSWLNPRGAGDRLSAGGLVTMNPGNQTYGYLDYDTPVGGAYRLSARVGNNDFDYDGVPGLTGGGLFLDLAARRSLSYSRTRGLTLVLAGSRQSLDWDDGADQTVTLAGVGLAAHRVLDAPRLATDGALSLSVGHLGGDRFLGQESDFWLLELDAEAWMPVSLPLLTGEQKLRVRLAAQWSDSLLPATGRLMLGGAHGARGFERDTFLADRGVVLGLEARVPVSLGEVVLFTDFAYGEGRAEDAESWARLADVGLGWDAHLTPSVTTRLSWAFPFTSRGTGDIDEAGSRVFWSLQYAH